MIPILFVGGMGTKVALMLGFTAADNYASLELETNSTGGLHFW
jgi:hypothetical protein